MKVKKYDRFFTPNDFISRDGKREKCHKLLRIIQQIKECNHNKLKRLEHLGI